ncbi:MAG: polyprenol monophosphomannose synthase [Anaerolineae bacterium]
MDSALILPTYNEAENLPSLVAQLLALNCGLHIIVVDDNSPDGTGQLAEALSDDGRVIARHRPAKLGLGTAYVEGFQVALAGGAQRMLTMDADFSHNPRYVPLLIGQTNSADLSIGSRYVAGGKTVNWGPERRLLSWSANTLARTALGLPTHDCTSGFRCYRRQVIEAIDLDTIRSSGYSFLIEMLYRVRQRGFSVAETPIVFEDRRAGRSKISEQEIFRAIATVARLSRDRYRSAHPEPPPSARKTL